MESRDPELALRLAADIVIAFLARPGEVRREDVPQLLREVRAALAENLEAPAPPSDASAEKVSELAPPAATGRRTPAVPVEDSITNEYIISLEDGRPYRSLRRHLMARHGLTPEQYRAKWGLPVDYPMVAPSYAAARSEVAKRSGLGRSPVAQAAARRTKPTRP